MPEPQVHSQKDRSTGHASHSRKSRSRSREILDAPRRPRDHYGSEDKREPRDYHRTTRGRSRSRSRSPPSRRRRSKSRSRSPQRHRRLNHRSRSRSRSPLRRKSKSRSRSKSRGRGDGHGHGGSKRRAVSRSRSRASSSSSAGSLDEHHKKRKKHKHKKRSRSRDKKERKKDRKHKKDKKKKDKGSSTAQWGKYGILTESDIYTKDAEFRSWLVEERVINPETITKDQTKKEFARFMEDFNTATLPHEKYYNMEHYEMRMSLLRNGETLPPTDDVYDPNADLLAHSSAHKRAPTERESYLSKEQVQELRRVQQERLQVGKMKQMGLEVKQTMGVRMVDAPE